MSKRATSTKSHDDSPSLALDAQLPAAARQELSALRRTLETRLATLEEVLQDPSRGESLPGLILELSRVATEEAQVAASHACIAIKAEGDKEIAALRASAQAALEAQAFLESAQTTLEHEQTLVADLRREVEKAKLEARKQADLLAARQHAETRLEADLVKQQAIAADLQRAAVDLQRVAADAQQQLEKERRSSAERQSQLDAERAAGAQLKQSAEAAVARFTSLERDLADERSAHEAAVADLADARAQARAAGDAVAAELSEARAARDAAATELAEARAAREAVVADLARERQAAADREQAQVQQHSKLEAELATIGRLRQSAEAAMARLPGLERDLADERLAHEAAVADLTEARADLDTAVADLARERKAAADRAEQLTRTQAHESSKGHEATEETALLQQSLAEARQLLETAHAEIEAERTSKAELRQAAELTDQQLASARSNEAQAVADHQKVAARLDEMTREREAITDELTAARKWINDLREAEAEFALPPAPPHVEAPPANAAPAKTKAKAKTPAPVTTHPRPDTEEPEEGWQAVRLAPRTLFSEGLSVQINGDPARLFDISISGCQVLSPTALKPNQLVKIVLPDKPPVACAGKVVWTRLEPMAAGQPLGYRAGIRFTKADEIGIEKFAARHAT